MPRPLTPFQETKFLVSDTEWPTYAFLFECCRSTTSSTSWLIWNCEGWNAERLGRPNETNTVRRGANYQMVSTVSNRPFNRHQQKKKRIGQKFDAKYNKLFIKQKCYVYVAKTDSVCEVTPLKYGTL